MSSAREIIPRDWKLINLGEECNFERGMEPGADLYNTEAIGERFLRVVDVTESRNIPVYVDVPTRKRLTSADIALTLDGTIGAVKKGLEGIYSTGIRKVTFKSKQYSNNLLYYILQSNNIQKMIELYASGSTIKHASSSIPHLTALIPISLHEQEKIYYVLNCIDVALKQTDEIIEKLKLIKIGLMQDLLRYGIDENGIVRSDKTHKFKKSPLGLIPEGWSVRPLSSLASFQNGKSFPSSEYCDSGVLLLRPGNLRINEFVEWNHNTTYLPRIWEKKAEKFLVFDNELVMNLTAQSLEEDFLGRVCLTPKGTRCLLNQRIARFREKDCYLPFLFWALRGEQFRAQIDRMPQGIKVQHLYNSNLKEIILSIPDSRAEQKEIAERLFNITTNLSDEEAFRIKLRDLKNGLMEDLLSGRVRVLV